MEVARIAATNRTTLVFAAGNNNVLAGIDALHRPSDVIVVSAIEKEYSDFNKAAFSNYGCIQLFLRLENRFTAQ
jgi:hypothetical protein